MKNRPSSLSAIVLVFAFFVSPKSLCARQQLSASSPPSAKQQARAKADIQLGDLALKKQDTRKAISDYKAAVFADSDNRVAHRKFIQTSIFSIDLWRPQKKKTDPRKNGKKLTNEQEKAEKSRIQAEQKRLQTKWAKQHAKVKAQLLATYDKWIKKNPRNAMFYWGKGEVYAFHSEDEQARPWFQKAIAVNPSCAAAWASLSGSAYMFGDVSEQRRDAERALALDPQDRSGVFFLYALSYFASDPAKFNTIVENRAAKYPDEQNLDYLLMLVAENTPNPEEQQAAYEKIYALYGPLSARPSDDLDQIMPQLFNLYARNDAAKALRFAEKVAHDRGAARATKAAAEKASAANTSSKSTAEPQKPFWQMVADYQKNIVDVRLLIAEKKYADAEALLARNDLKPENDYDPLGQIDRTPYQLTKAEALAGAGQLQNAYDTVRAALLPKPDEALEAALVSYGVKLGKNPAQVRQDVWKAREAKAKPFTPFDLAQYVTDKDVKLADFRGHIVLVNFWYPG